MGVKTKAGVTEEELPGLDGFDEEGGETVQVVLKSRVKVTQRMTVCSQMYGRRSQEEKLV